MKTLQFCLTICLFASLFGINIFAQNDIISQWFAMQKNPPKDTPEIRQKTFETAWQTVKDNHFEADYNGVDWDKIREKYSPLVAETKNDEELIKLLIKMVRELKRSHNQVMSPKNIVKGDSKNDADAGITLKFIDGEAVVTKVEANSPSDKAGIRQGFIVKSIDDIETETIKSEAMAAEWVPYLKLQSADSELRKRLVGEAKSKFRLKFFDEKNKLRSVTLERLPMKGEMSKAFGVVPNFIQVETRKLPGNIGYFRFNTFFDSEKQILAALDTILDSSAIILDLRDNRGGSPDVEQSLASMFFSKITIFNKAKNRKDFQLSPSGFAFPSKKNFTGKLVILVNLASASASEDFSAGLQELGRATIIGEKTAGNLLLGTPKLLPNGAVQMFTPLAPATPKGIVIEGRGVVPDIEVKLTREILLKGGDAQLQAAIDFLNKPTQ